MSDMINYWEIKSAIDKRLCPEHQENPIVEVTATGIKLNVCCEPFKQALTQHVKEMTAQQAKDYALRQIQNMLGR